VKRKGEGSTGHGGLVHAADLGTQLKRTKERKALRMLMKIKKNCAKHFDNCKCKNCVWLTQFGLMEEITS